MPPKNFQGDSVVGAHYNLWKVLGGRDAFPSDHSARAASYTVEIEERAVEVIKDLKKKLEKLKESVDRRVAEENRELRERVEKLENGIVEKGELLEGFCGPSGIPPRRPSVPGATCAQQ
ncbi:MAG: hypothetical protein Q9187_000714 [Circinaria calcarea]